MYDTTQSIRLLIDIAKNSSELSDLRSEGIIHMTYNIVSYLAQIAKINVSTAIIKLRIWEDRTILLKQSVMNWNN